MPIFAASSGMVIPGCPVTNASASAARVPLPLRRPARRGVELLLLLVVLPAGRPGFLRAGGRACFLRPALAGAVAVAVGAAVSVAFALVRLTEPRGRPGPRRRGAAAT